MANTKHNRITKPRDFRNQAPMNIRQAMNLIAAVMRRIQERERQRDAFYSEGNEKSPADGVFISHGKVAE